MPLRLRTLYANNFNPLARVAAAKAEYAVARNAAIAAQACGHPSGGPYKTAKAAYDTAEKLIGELRRSVEISPGLIVALKRNAEAARLNYENHFHTSDRESQKDFTRRRDFTARNLASGAATD
ncbi:MAG: hypothetical protein QM706_11950 [Nitrospira sp.]